MPRGRAQASDALIEAASTFLARVQPVSVRAVCYHLFIHHRALMPSMETKYTKRVSRLLVDAREKKEIPWSWIVDETREAERISAWADPAEYADAVVRSYRKDRWTRQPRTIEVWSEKGTVRGTLAPVLDTYAVTFRVYHGFTSATAVRQVVEDADGLRSRHLVVFYVGDYDPSGMYMSEVDLPARLEEHRADLGTDAQIDLHRLAITDEDLTAGDLPAFPADEKRADSRYRWYVERYGRRCWELDAMDPEVLRARVEAALVATIEPEQWARDDVAEAAERASIVGIMGQMTRRRGEGRRG